MGAERITVMTKEEWIGVAKVLNDAYEFNGKAMFETPDKIMYWFSCLEDLDYKVVCVAAKKLAMTSPNRPTIADIRRECANLTVTEPPMSESEAWNLVRVALRNSTYGADEEFERLPATVKRAVVSPDRLREWCQLSSDTVSSVVRAEFRRSFESAQNSAMEERQMGAMGKLIAEKLAKQLTMTREEIQIGLKEGI